MLSNLKAGEGNKRYCCQFVTTNAIDGVDVREKWSSRYRVNNRIIPRWKRDVLVREGVFYASTRQRIRPTIKAAWKVSL